MIAGAACRPETPPDQSPANPCSVFGSDLPQRAFVVVTDPAPGARATSPLEVSGCSSTFESNVVWELRGRDGRILASGHTMGGGLDSPRPFRFTAAFETRAPQLAHLEVFEVDESEGEGFPPGRSVLPLMLLP